MALLGSVARAASDGGGARGGGGGRSEAAGGGPASTGAPRGAGGGGGGERKGREYPEDSQPKHDTAIFESDEFRINCYKILSCSKRSGHDWRVCPFAHPGERARRRPLSAGYVAEMCSYTRRGLPCPMGDACMKAHNTFESWLHPGKYRTQMCADAPTCRRQLCFFAHSFEELRVPSGAGTGPAYLPIAPAASPAAYLAAPLAGGAAAAAAPAAAPVPFDAACAGAAAAVPAPQAGGGRGPVLWLTPSGCAWPPTGGAAAAAGAPVPAPGQAQAGAGQAAPQQPQMQQAAAPQQAFYFDYGPQLQPPAAACRFVQVPMAPAPDAGAGSSPPTQAAWWQPHPQQPAAFGPGGAPASASAPLPGAAPLSFSGPGAAGAAATRAQALPHMASMSDPLPVLSVPGAAAAAAAAGVSASGGSGAHSGPIYVFAAATAPPGAPPPLGGASDCGYYPGTI